MPIREKRQKCDFAVFSYCFQRSFAALLLRMTEGEATRTPACVTLSSSSLAYAVSILPFGKMLDLQSGSSSSQKSRFAAIFGSPVFFAQSNGSLTFAPLSFRPQDDRRGSNANARLCHPELVVARLCCQHFAEWQNARLARRLLLFPKISLHCDFREPCYNSPPSGEILCGAHRETNAVPFHAFTLCKGEGGTSRFCGA